jgi:hypothetical protein
LLGTRLGIRLPGRTKSLACSFEGGLIDLAIAFNSVDSASKVVGDCGDSLGALVPAHCGGTAVEGLDMYDSLVGSHSKAIGQCLLVKCFAPLLKNG